MIDDGDGSVGEALAKPINDFVVVLQMPAGVERKHEADKDGDDGKREDGKGGQGRAP